MIDRPPPVGVPWQVLEGIETVAEQSDVHMTNRQEVMALARSLGYHETYAWLDDALNREDYSRGIKFGFRAIEGGEQVVGGSTEPLTGA